MDENLLYYILHQARFVIYKPNSASLGVPRLKAFPPYLASLPNIFERKSGCPLSIFVNSIQPPTKNYIRIL